MLTKLLSIFMEKLPFLFPVIFSFSFCDGDGMARLMALEILDFTWLTVPVEVSIKLSIAWILVSSLAPGLQ